MLTILTNLTPGVYMWTCTIWMTLFAASCKWSGNSEQVFINQLNFRPTSIGTYNSMGYLLPWFRNKSPDPYICKGGLEYLAWQLSRSMLFQWDTTNRKFPESQMSAAPASVWRTLYSETIRLFHGLHPLLVLISLGSFIVGLHDYWSRQPRVFRRLTLLLLQ